MLLFVNKVLLGQCHSHLFMCRPWLLFITAAEVSGFNRDHMAYKVYIGYFGPLRKPLLTPTLVTKKTFYKTTVIGRLGCSVFDPCWQRCKRQCSTERTVFSKMILDNYDIHTLKKKVKYHIQKLTQIGPFLHVKPKTDKLLEESTELGMWPWIK